MQWKPIQSAPKDTYSLGYDPCLKRPFVMAWDTRKGAFYALGGFGDEVPTHWLPIPEDWLPLESAPKDSYCLGYDVELDRPFVMIWNVCEGEFVPTGSLEDEKPAKWTPLPPVPSSLN